MRKGSKCGVVVHSAALTYYNNTNGCGTCARLAGVKHRRTQVDVITLLGKSYIIPLLTFYDNYNILINRLIIVHEKKNLHFRVCASSYPINDARSDFRLPSRAAEVSTVLMSPQQ
jgi:hypothetical protein